ncbi:MAG: 4-hydroxy-tetrahydrodipicolinate reductase [Bacteroidales bacterium]|nr:4-hydroxy-tetrahydrodipicolinate reductase [Bacteroidales bacterium]MBN2697951.1 4-hydroxy-tetrahydrodipicolinate reductase [Bacteroidales bacterium]
MNICLLGYGRMGHEVETTGTELGHRFPLIIDKNNTADLNPGNLKGIDAVINFSSPESAPEQILLCLQSKVPVVSGTTGMNNRLKEIRERCIFLNGAFFYASNFSIGVNIFSHINAILAGIMNRFKEYRVSLEEIHHIHKLDAPSGTAIMLAEKIIENRDDLEGWSLDPEHRSGTVPVKAVRKGEVKGFHAIKYESDIDEIVISHSARSRKGFVSGAIMAAEFLQGKTGCYGMTDLLKL